MECEHQQFGEADWTRQLNFQAESPKIMILKK